MDYDVFLEQLKARASIEDIISEYVALKRAGNRFVGLCPFHSEKTPSFTVFADTQSFFCFGCSAGGDVITFIRKAENLDYTDAVRFLADKTGLEMPQEKNEGEFRMRRETVLKINKETARHFHENLLGSPGAAGREYCEGRKLSQSTIVRFGLGWAPDSWDDCLNHLLRKGYTKDQLFEAGLVVRNKTGGYYDRFRSRVMFPIIDTMGNVIAFGGRIIEAGEPKYLNSPDTPVFKKSRQLFALNFAKNNNEGRLILCEGYMDVISLHQAGFTSAVATLGTAITADQARIMARYANQVVIAYDTDDAGQTASKKAIKLLTETGLTVKMLAMGDVKDPDEYIKKYGAQRFKRLIDNSGSHTTFLLDKALSVFDMNIPEDKAAYLKEAARIISEIPSAVEAEVYTSKVAQQTEISADVIKAEIKSIMESRAKAEKKRALKTETDRIMGARDRLNPGKRENLKAAVAEEGLIAILLKHPDYYEKLSIKITQEDFVTDFNKNIFGIMLRVLAQQGQLDLTRLAQHLTVDEVARVTQYTIKSVSGENEKKQAEDYAKAIKEVSSSAALDLSQSDPEQIKKYIEQAKMAKERRE